jgi:choloylglycine hydrolase
MVFGRNYDWVAGTGMVCTNQRGLLKTSFKVPDGSTITWSSRYGSITFNQYGKEFPTGGMNEKGLVVELMWLDETVYPKADERPAVGVLQWIQYQLDNCVSIDEVIATDRQLRITASTSPLHYLVADANGNAATIEFLQGKLVAHRGSELSFPVLTNSVYAQSVQYARSALQKNEPVEGSGSLERFAKACQMIQEYRTAPNNTSLIDHSFNILEAVSQGDYTRWSIVYDITNLRVYFRTNAAPQIKSASFAAFEFTCNQPPLYFNMNQPTRGEISRMFRPMRMEANAEMIRQTSELSKSQVTVPAATQQAMALYANLIGCK